MRRLIVTSGLLIAILVAPSLRAQVQSRIVPDLVSCGACAIEFREVVRLTTGDSAITSIPMDVFAARNGAIYVAEFGQLPHVFAADGRYLRDLGTRGRGPGEFTGTVGFSGAPSDSLLVHLDDGRVIVVDADNDARRQVSFPTALHPLRVLDWPHRVIAAGFLGSAQAAGYQLHVLDVSSSPARVLSSFGWDSGRLRANSGQELAPHLTSPRAGSFWAADPLEYRFGQWNAAGENLSQLRRSASWFAGRSQAWIGNPSTPPPPRVIGIAEDQDGLLWIYSRVAQRNWKAGWPQISRESSEISSSAIDREKLFEVIVEVIDPRAGRVVARQTLQQFIIQVLDNGDLVSYRLSADGAPEVGIHRPSLHRP